MWYPDWLCRLRNFLLQTRARWCRMISWVSLRSYSDGTAWLCEVSRLVKPSGMIDELFIRLVNIFDYCVSLKCLMALLLCFFRLLTQSKQ
jgi:hypothetical protein